jgi:hypothetical protein
MFLVHGTTSLVSANNIYKGMKMFSSSGGTSL